MFHILRDTLRLPQNLRFTKPGIVDRLEGRRYIPRSRFNRALAAARFESRGGNP